MKDIESLVAAPENIYAGHRISQQENKQHTRPATPLEQYVQHRFGTTRWGEIRYENRCSCCELLHDRSGEGNERQRAHIARTGDTPLSQDSCFLCPFGRQRDDEYPQAAGMPVLMVTTPEGETFYPHDMTTYSDPPAPAAAAVVATPPGSSGIGRVLPPLRPQAREGFVPYEEEDTPDI
jgi:hypothetical protein